MVCCSGALRGVTRGGQQQFATQTLRVHLLSIDYIEVPMAALLTVAANAGLLHVGFKAFVGLYKVITHDGALDTALASENACSSGTLVAQSSAIGVIVAAVPPCRAIRFRNPKCRNTLHQPAAPPACCE